MILTNILSTETSPASVIASPYADLTVPAINIILEVSALILLIGAVVAGILLLRNHVRSWLFPFGVGLVFHLVFRYTLFNSRFGLINFLFDILNKYVPFLKGQDTLLSIAFIVLDIGSTILAVILSVGYWKKSALRDHRPFQLGGAMAIGVAAYVVNLIASGYLSILYSMISNSRMINGSGFESVLNSYLSQDGSRTKQEIVEYLMGLTTSDVKGFIEALLNAAALILEAAVPITIAVIRYGVVSEQMEKKWNWAVVGLPFGLAVMPLIRTLSNFDAFAYVSFGYALALAAFCVWLTYHVSVTYMEKEWSLLGYTRKKQKCDEEKEKNKMPKIQMPKD